MVAKYVTDHALVRYMERVLGYDVEAIRKSMVTPDVITALHIGASKVNIHGIEFRCSDRKVVTVIDRGDKSGRPRHKGKKNRKRTRSNAGKRSRNL